MIEKILKISSISLARLNNAEYLSLMIRLDEEITIAGVSNIGITQEVADGFQRNVKILSDVFAQNKASVDTALLQNLDNQRDVIWQHIMNAIKNAAKSPIQKERDAYQILNPELKPYGNKTNIALEQETQLIRGFLLDMQKPQNKPQVIALGLLPAMEELHTTNEKFARIYGKRALDQLDKLPNSKTLRKTMDDQFAFITQKAYGTNIATPTTTSTTFINNMNIHIKTANDAYHFRMTHTAKKSEEAGSTENGNKIN